MPLIKITTFIEAPQERVFDLCRSINFHAQTMKKYGETAIGGRLEGLIEEGETVMWKAKHFFRERQLTSKISVVRRPEFFVDEQIKGDFKKIYHEHFFKPCDNGTIMIDHFYYELPYGLAGKILSKIYMNNYLKDLLVVRNNELKKAAESSQWKLYLSQ